MLGPRWSKSPRNPIRALPERSERFSANRRLAHVPVSGPSPWQPPAPALSPPGGPDERLQHSKKLHHLGGRLDRIARSRMLTLAVHDDPHTRGAKRPEDVFIGLVVAHIHGVAALSRPVALPLLQQPAHRRAFIPRHHKPHFHHNLPSAQNQPPDLQK